MNENMNIGIQHYANEYFGLGMGGGWLIGMVAGILMSHLGLFGQPCHGPDHGSDKSKVT
ncbi:MAG: hypothetical protein HW411_1381 [Gammaproteobacteria bacterium]|nr:hypothetical protein [Gammaproteobacteria bacterium]